MQKMKGCSRRCRFGWDLEFSGSSVRSKRLVTFLPKPNMQIAQFLFTQEKNVNEMNCRPWRDKQASCCSVTVRPHQTESLSALVAVAHLCASTSIKWKESNFSSSFREYLTNYRLVCPTLDVQVTIPPSFCCADRGSGDGRAENTADTSENTFFLTHKIVHCNDLPWEQVD